MFEILSVCKGGGYRYCRTRPPHPRRNSNGLYPLHIVVAENALGRLLVPGEVVHHLDENKDNDDPSNLVVLSNSQHATHHKTKNQPPVTFTCPCGASRELPPHVYRQRLARAQGGVVHCSRSCATQRQRAAERDKTPK